MSSSCFFRILAFACVLLVIASCSPAAQNGVPSASLPEVPSPSSSHDRSPVSAPAVSDISKAVAENPPATVERSSMGPTARLDDQPASGVPLSADAKKLLARADAKVKGYSFIYAAPPDNLARDTYFVKGDRVKVELFDRGWFKADTHMTHVYLDGATKNAVGVCEDPRSTHCPDPKRKFPVTYSDYAIKMPYQWLKEIKVGTLASGEKIFERMTKKITYTQGTETIEQWIDEYSGLPVRVKVTDAQGPRLYEFRHLTVNDVSDDIFSKSPLW